MPYYQIPLRSKRVIPATSRLKMYTARSSTMPGGLSFNVVPQEAELPSDTTRTLGRLRLLAATSIDTTPKTERSSAKVGGLMTYNDYQQVKGSRELASLHGYLASLKLRPVNLLLTKNDDAYPDRQDEAYAVVPQANVLVDVEGRKIEIPAPELVVAGLNLVLAHAIAPPNVIRP